MKKHGNLIFLVLVELLMAIMFFYDDSLMDYTLKQDKIIYVIAFITIPTLRWIEIKTEK